MSLLIRHFSATPGSALFAALERDVQPEPVEGDGGPDLLPHQVFQVLRWSSTDEGLRQVVVALRQQLTASTGVKIDLPPYPWEQDAPDAERARVKAMAAVYESTEAKAARAVVAPPVIPERS